MMPLEGLRILDLSRLLPGPFCSMILADMGAEVLKVEDTKIGDYMRTMGSVVNQESIEFLMLNRNKKSMKLDLKSSKGKEIFMKLAQEYDVIIEQFRPGVMDKLGIGYQDVKKFNPRIIYCSLTGYGQYGPYAHLAGHDTNYLSIAGVLDTIGVKDGAPVMPGIQIADVAGGSLWAAIAILIAVLGREKTGRGQFLDVAMLDGVMPFLWTFAGSYLLNGQLLSRGDTVGSGSNACCNIYETKDGRYVSLAASEQKFWQGFCQGIERPEFISEQYAAEPRRSELLAEVRTIMKTRTQAEWVEEFQPYDICFTPIKNIQEAFADPQVQARNMVIEVNHPVEGKIPTIAFPVKFSETPAKVFSSPPLYGEHTGQILKEIGYSDNQIDELRELKTI